LNEIKASNSSGKIGMNGVGVDYELLLKSHKNFVKFVHNYSFDDYLNNYTLFQNGKSNGSADHSDNDVEILDEKEENFRILLKLSKALANPRTIELISSILVNDTD
jgi:hypothetical protein